MAVLPRWWRACSCARIHPQQCPRGPGQLPPGVYCAASGIPDTKDQQLASEAAVNAYAPDREQQIKALVAAARAYRDAETDGTPRMWRGKDLQDLANALDDALAPFAEDRK